MERAKSKVHQFLRRPSPSTPTTPRSFERHREHLLQQCPKSRISFLEPMKSTLVEVLPKSGDWYYELKFDGFRALALKNGNSVQLLSRNHKDLSRKYPELVEAALNITCQSAVLDGEIVALDKRGCPSFQLLQNLGSRDRNIYYFAFDLIHMDGRDLTDLPIEERRWLLEPLITKENERLLFSSFLDGSPEAIMALIKQHGLEGVIAKRAGSKYEAGQRSRSWLKYKNLLEQELVIGGYTSPKGARESFGALLVGYYENAELKFAGKVGTGFTSDLLRKLYFLFQGLRQNECPFVNLPENSSGPWGEGLTVAKMAECRWLKPKLICSVGFIEWTEGGDLRHLCFRGMRDDKLASEVAKEVVNYLKPN